MAFDLSTWKQSAADKLRGIGGWLDRRKTQDAPLLVYGTLCGLSLWPLVEAMQRGEILPAMMALGSVAGGVGGNLIAEQVQRWKDSADKVNEAKVRQWVAEHAASDADLRAALDVILKQLEAIPTAKAALNDQDREWFTQTLKGELARLGNAAHFEATLIGSGAIAQGEGAVAAGAHGVAVGGSVQGDINVTEVHYHGSVPLGSMSPRPLVYHNLPHPDYGAFVGRDDELEQVHRLLRPYPHSQHSVVVIDGIGGIGKSALALEVAHRYLRRYERLPKEERFDAIIWTSAKAAVLTADGIAPRRQVMRTLDDVYITISVALEREDITRARADEQDDLVCRALARQRTLLIIDNLETIDDERVNAFLRELPAPTKCIVTTRHRIDVAFAVRLEGMPSQDALALIAQECEKKRVVITDEQSRLLCRRTGGVPLAIVWSIAQMGFGYGAEMVLRRLGTATSDIARYCFEGAMEHLRGKPAHQLLMALSQFATDAGREALGHVADLPELDRDEGLVELERLSLVNKSGARFWMLPLTKQYAMHQVSGAAESGRKMSDRWLGFLMTIASQWGGANVRQFENLDPDRDNLLEAMSWCWRSGEENTGAQLTRLTGLYFWMRGLWKECIANGERALAVAEATQDRELEALICQEIGRVYYSSSELVKAARYQEQSLGAYQALHDNEGISRMAGRLGITCTRLKKYEEADELYRQGLEIARTFGYSNNVARILGDMARQAIDQKKWGLAGEYLDEAIALKTALGKDLLGLTPLYRRKCELEMKSPDGNLAEARRFAELGLKLAKDLGSRLDVAFAQRVQALLSEKLGEHKEALRLAREALDTFDQLGVKGPYREEMDQLLREVVQ